MKTFKVRLRVFVGFRVTTIFGTGVLWRDSRGSVKEDNDYGDD